MNKVVTSQNRTKTELNMKRQVYFKRYGAAATTPSQPNSPKSQLSPREKNPSSVIVIQALG